MEKKLCRVKDGKILGVCGGIADYLDVDRTVLRLIVVALMLIYGTGLLAYLIAALIMPKEQ